MFEKVMVGVDDREGGRDAIALAEVLVPAGGQLTLVYVYTGDPHAWHGSLGVSDTDARERALEVLEKARAGAGVEAELRWQGSPSAGRGLHEVAEAIGADLLVVGSSRRGLIGRVLVRDDTRAALNGAPCAVAIAPAGYSERPFVMREIGVGYDASPESEHALKVARTLAAQHHTKLSAFQAVSIPAHLVHGRMTVDDAALDDLVQDARARVAALDDVEPHAAYGEPAEELALYSASLDLLIVGSRGYGPVGRLVHGSTSQHLARTARCPLLVLTRAARAADAPAAHERTESGRGRTRD
jgi:nucleotide-binding universal stress UspA family protein